MDKCYECPKCKSHNWHPLNAFECCQDRSDAEIAERRQAHEGKRCTHCGKIMGETKPDVASDNPQ